MDSKLDNIFFVSWCIEQYKAALGLKGEAVANLFYKYRIMNYLSDNYEVLHTQGRQWLMEEISDVLVARGCDEVGMIYRREEAV